MIRYVYFAHFPFQITEVLHVALKSTYFKDLLIYN